MQSWETPALVDFVRDEKRSTNSWSKDQYIQTYIIQENKDCDERAMFKGQETNG